MTKLTKECNNLIELVKNSIEIPDERDRLVLAKACIAKEILAFFQYGTLNDNGKNLLKMFSFYVASQKNHIYNMGYYTEHIENFCETHKKGHERLKTIIENALQISTNSKGVLVGKTICYDNLYSFDIGEKGIQNVHFEIELLGNLFKKSPITIRISSTQEKVLEFSRDYDIKLLNEPTSKNGVKEWLFLKDYQDMLAYFTSNKIESEKDNNTSSPNE